jgi:hypothetical protein
MLPSSSRTLWASQSTPVTAHDPTHGVGDVGGVEAGGGHLVEQRQERVEVVPVDEGDLDVDVGQAAGGREPAEAGADDHDLGFRHGAPPGAWQVGHQ